MDQRESASIDFVPRYGSFLTVNIGDLKWREDRFLEFTFLQPIDASKAIVRPVGGTPRPTILALDSRSVSLEFQTLAQVIRLRIVTPLVPIIRNLGPSGVPNENRLAIEATIGADGRLYREEPRVRDGV